MVIMKEGLNFCLFGHIKHPSVDVLKDTIKKRLVPLQSDMYKIIICN